MTATLSGYKYTASGENSVVLKIFEWVGSPVSSITISMSTVTSPVPSATYHNRTLRVAGTFPVPVRVRMGFTDVPFSQMTSANGCIEISNTPTASYDQYVTIPETMEGALVLYFKTADVADVQQPYVGKVNMIALAPGPIGVETKRLLRNRKYFYNNSGRRWDGKEVE